MVTCSHSNHVNQRGYKDKRSQLSTTTRISQLPINGASRKLKAHPVEITSFPEASVRKGIISHRRCPRTATRYRECVRLLDRQPVADDALPQQVLLRWFACG